MKKIATFFLAILMIFSFSQFAYADYSIPSYIRIGLFYGSNAKNDANIYSENGFYIGTYFGTEFSENEKISNTEISVSFKDDGIYIKNAQGDILYKTTDTTKGVGVFPTKGGMNRRFKIGGEEYRGGLDFKVVNGNKVITNVVFMNNYLYGVISREMSPSWHIEALKAQAVCARNYAANNLNKHAQYGFDLCNTVCCQAYAGVRFETENSYAPVDDTSNQILSYDGKPAQLYYSSSMGERTEDVVNVWGNSVPYLISVDNSYEDTENITNGVWSGSLSCDEATTVMRNKGYNVGEVTSIVVVEYTENGRVLKMTVTGTQGSKTFERESCRTIFNTVTKSQAFKVSGNGDMSQKIPTVDTTDGDNFSKKKIDELVILSADGRSNLTGNKLYVSNGVVQEIYDIENTSTEKNTAFYFEGTGWGHSVGMSQYGAKGMAEAGYSYVDILLHYFPGTNLENAY